MAQERSMSDEEFGRPRARGRTKQTGYVEYIGNATRRVITAQQWRQAGVNDQAGSEWNIRNNFKVPVDDFNGDALGYLRNDVGFSVPSK